LSTWSWISRTRERKALELYIEHISKIKLVVDHATEALRAYREGDFKRFNEEWNKVFDLEREADDLKRKILAELSRGVFHPIDREEVIRLVINSDDIASHAKAWTRRLHFVQRELVHTSILDRLVEMANCVKEATKLIKDASAELIAGHENKVLEIANMIETLEENVDDVRAEALREVFTYCDSAKVSHCLLVKEIVDIIEDAADECENVADVLRSVALFKF